MRLEDIRTGQIVRIPNEDMPVVSYCIVLGAAKDKKNNIVTLCLYDILGTDTIFALDINDQRVKQFLSYSAESTLSYAFDYSHFCSYNVNELELVPVRPKRDLVKLFLTKSKLVSVERVDRDFFNSIKDI